MNTKSIIIVGLFRLSSLFSGSLWLRILGFPFRLIYRFVVIWLLGIDLPDTTQIGNNLRIYHGTGLVVHSCSTIGSNVVLRHCTTIGNNGVTQEAPVIGDNVDIGSNVVIIGPVSICSNVIIGAGSVVTKSIVESGTYVGNPARRLKD